MGVVDTAMVDTASDAVDSGGATSDSAQLQTASIALVSDDTCDNPCTFEAVASGDIVTAQYEADGWDLGTSAESGFALTYEFAETGVRMIAVYGLDENGSSLAEDIRYVKVKPTGCESVESADADAAPIQVVGADVPSGTGSISWEEPTTYTYTGAFSGQEGSSATHEGLDYVHDSSAVSSVSVNAAAAGTVVYVRNGCPESATFSPNASVRECGAGWGNHIVVYHGDEIYTRYAHLEDDSAQVQVGDVVTLGQAMALMGNSGRSDVRHLHFELGGDADGLDSCDGSQSFDLVYDPALLDM